MVLTKGHLQLHLTDIIMQQLQLLGPRCDVYMVYRLQVVSIQLLFYNIKRAKMFTYKSREKYEISNHEKL